METVVECTKLISLVKTRGGGTKSVEHIRSEYPGCVGVQAKNEEVPQGTNSGIFGAKYRKINYFAHILSLNLPEDDREAWNQTKMT